MTQFATKLAQISGYFGAIRKHHDLRKTTVATFEQLFEKIGLLLIPSFAHAAKGSFEKL